MAHQIKFRRDTAANFTSSNPTLAAGEPGFETDTGKLKVGDGTTAWSSLSYSTDPTVVSLTSANVLTTDMTMKQFSESVNAVGNSSGSVTVDHNLGSIHTLTLTGDITQFAFSNLATGESGILVLTQDVTGGHTFASTNMIFAGGAPTLTSAGGSIDVISFVSDGTNVLASFSGDYKA